MRATQTRRDERSQAFTLEGFVAAIIVLTAVLLALQSAVITPTTGGAIDRTAQAQAEQEVKDVLVVAEEEDQALSKLVRYWDNESEEFHDSTPLDNAAYNNSDFAEQSRFGEILDKHFVERGNSYNVEFIFFDEDGDRETETIVQMGGGTADGVVSASYTVTIFDDQRLTVPDEDNGIEESDETPTVGDAHEEDEYPISPSSDDHDTVYNVVEVRVTVW